MFIPIIKADVQGAETIRALAPEALAIFLAPTGMEELEARLTARLTESPGALALRLKTAANEMREAQKFDHIVYNPDGRIDEAAVWTRALDATEVGALLAAGLGCRRRRS